MCLRIPKVLVVHNFYQQSGGEDAVFDAETELLRAHGHAVVQYTEDNHRITHMNPLRLAGTTIWSQRVKSELEFLILREKPSIVHFHNTFPLISPAAYFACKAMSVPIVQTLHNYRILCPAGNLYRDGLPCEECLCKAIPWPGVFHRCYRSSRAATAVVAGMVAVHHRLGTWDRLVNSYIALSEFARRKFVEGGLPSEKIHVKPNFAQVDSGVSEQPGRFALFLGRLSREKGPQMLLQAWRNVGGRVPLVIIGDGPLRHELETYTRREHLNSVSFVGHVERRAALSLLREALFAVVPSECYENFPLSVVEAFACGVPVIAPKLGALEEIIQENRTGLHFEPGSPADLANKINWACSHPSEMKIMGCAARAEYEARFTAERNYVMLIQIYTSVITAQRPNEYQIPANMAQGVGKLT